MPKRTDIHRLTHIAPWFRQNIKEIVEMEDQIASPGSLAKLASV